MKTRACLALAIALAAASAQAQAPPPGHDGMPAGLEIPAGPGELLGQLIHPGGAGATAGLEVILYALMPDGTPGVARAQTDAEGRFRFEQITNATGTVFLVAARYREVPFGERFTFASGETSHRVALEISDPIAASNDLRALDTRIHVDAAGEGAAIHVSHRLAYDGEGVLYVEESGRLAGDPLFVARLPKGASELRPITMSLGESVERRGNEVWFWGPVFPGRQQLEYTYALPAAGRALALELEFPSELGLLVLTTPEDGFHVSSNDLSSTSALESEGQRVRAFTAAGLEAGARVSLTVTLPDFRRDADALELAEATLWLELDDTNLVVTTEIQLGLDDGADLMASGADPLLHLELPSAAEFMGVSPEMTEIGAARVEGGIDLRGPVKPGETSFSFRYRLPSEADATRLDLRFPRPVGALHVMVADTGIAIETDRLHRRRPVRSGTRVYLHREAFRIAADETVRIALQPISGGGLPHAVSLSAAVALALMGAFFVAAPLRRRGHETVSEPGESAADVERSLLYATIRDLDHDFETGKIAEEDYEASRRELRAQAVELLRRERAAAVPEAPVSAPLAAPAGRYCPGCGEVADAAWRFCSHCGGVLPPARPESESDG